MGIRALSHSDTDRMKHRPRIAVALLGLLVRAPGAPASVPSTIDQSDVATVIPKFKKKDPGMARMFALALLQLPLDGYGTTLHCNT
jgi:hypothetical protein